jgi:hypothetical protein
VIELVEIGKQLTGRGLDTSTSSVESRRDHRSAGHHRRPVSPVIELVEIRPEVTTGVSTGSTTGRDSTTGFPVIEPVEIAERVTTTVVSTGLDHRRAGHHRQPVSPVIELGLH